MTAFRNSNEYVALFVNLVQPVQRTNMIKIVISLLFISNNTHTQEVIYV